MRPIIRSATHNKVRRDPILGRDPWFENPGLNRSIVFDLSMIRMDRQRFTCPLCDGKFWRAQRIQHYEVRRHFNNYLSIDSIGRGPKYFSLWAIGGASRRGILSVFQANRWRSRQCLARRQKWAILWSKSGLAFWPAIWIQIKLKMLFLSESLPKMWF